MKTEQASLLSEVAYPRKTAFLAGWQRPWKRAPQSLAEAKKLQASANKDHKGGGNKNQPPQNGACFTSCLLNPPPQFQRN